MKPVHRIVAKVTPAELQQLQQLADTCRTSLAAIVSQIVATGLADLREREQRREVSA